MNLFIQLLMEKLKLYNGLIIRKTNYLIIIILSLNLVLWPLSILDSFLGILNISNNSIIELLLLKLKLILPIIESNIDNYQIIFNFILLQMIFLNIKILNSKSKVILDKGLMKILILLIKLKNKPINLIQIKSNHLIIKKLKLNNKLTN